MCDQPEFFDAYQFAKNFGITSATSCESARMESYITRAEFAKMSSVLAKDLLGKKPVHNDDCYKFTDISAYTSLTPYIQLACTLQLMGMQLDGVHVSAQFNPAQTVKISHLATVISRMIFGTEYNIPLSQYVK